MKNVKLFFANKHLQKKIWFTFAVLLVWLFGITVTVPGIDSSALKGVFDGASVLGIMNLMSGGSLERFSLFAMGVSPYITASIIIQLLSMDVIPPLSEMREDGEKGQVKLDKITRYFSVVLAFVQAISLTYAFDRQYGILTNASVSGYISSALIMTAGTMFLIWLGDAISEHGVGNGLSIMIFAGIASSIPSQFMQTWAMTVGGAEGQALINGALLFAAYCLVYLLIIVVVVVMETAERRIPVHYSGRAAGNNMTYIPLKINSASVIPVIFAQSVLTVPQMILSFVNYDLYTKLEKILSLNTWGGLAIYAALIIVFTFFYTDLTIDPENMAKNLKRNNGAVPGIRPGENTRKYISRVMNRVTFFGMIVLLMLAITPYLLPMITSIPSTISIGGTGLIILVGVAMETTGQIETLLTKKNYDKSWF